MLVREVADPELAEAEPLREVGTGLITPASADDGSASEDVDALELAAEPLLRLPAETGMPDALLDRVALAAGELRAMRELREDPETAGVSAAEPLGKAVLGLVPVPESGAPVVVGDTPVPLSEWDAEDEGMEAFNIPEPAGRLEDEGTEVSDPVAESEEVLQLVSSIEPSSSLYSHSSQSLLSSTFARNSDGFCCQLTQSHRKLTSSSFHCHNMSDPGHSKSFSAKHWPRSSGVMKLISQLWQHRSPSLQPLLTLTQTRLRSWQPACRARASRAESRGSRSAP